MSHGQTLRKGISKRGNGGSMRHQFFKGNWCNEPNCLALQVLAAGEMAHESLNQILSDTNSWYVKGRQQGNALEWRVTRQDKGSGSLIFSCFPMFFRIPNVVLLLIELE